MKNLRVRPRDDGGFLLTQDTKGTLIFLLIAIRKEYAVRRHTVLLLTIAAFACLRQGDLYAQANANNSLLSPADSIHNCMVYVSHASLDYVSVLDPATNRVVRKIKAGKGTVGVELSPQLDHGYVANFNSNDVTVFDAKTGDTIATVSAGEHPSMLLLTADARYLLIAHQSQDGLWFLDTHTNTVVKKLGEGTGYLCRDRLGKKIYQSQIFTPFVFVIDPETQTIQERINVGGRPLDCALTPDQRHLYVANYNLNEVEQIDTRTDSVVGRIQNVSNARGIAVTPDRKYAYVTNVQASTVTVIDLASATVVKAIPVGTMPVSIVMIPDGRHAYVACQGNASVFVIDTKTMNIIDSIVVGSNPITVQVR